jgi:DNA-directed RNA polymerase subunit RPC12/RpoP
MGKAADWLREERRKVLGDWAAVCLDCGAAQRWFEAFESELPERCPACGGTMLHRCPACGAPFSSVFAVECERCAAPLRPAEQFGVRIRRESQRSG